MPLKRRGLRALAYAWLAASSLACVAHTEAAPAPAPASCDPATQRVGTYLFTYTEQSGTCGPIPQQLIVLDPNAKGDGSCVLNADRASENGCKSERDVTCHVRVQDATAWGGVGLIENHTVGVTRQLTADGSHISGTASISLNDGTHACTSTYAVDLVRQ